MHKNTQTYRIVIGSIFILFYLIFSIEAVGMVRIHVVSDSNFVGDRSNLMGIAHQTKFELLSNGEKSEILEYSLQDLEKLEKTLENNEKKNILITAGTYGIEAIKRIKSNKAISDKILAIHVFHQMITQEKYGQLSVLKTKKQDGADIIALPSHTLNERILESFKESDTILVPTIGVAHKTTEEDLKIAFDNHKHILPRSDKYLGVILPGDAPDSSGKMNYFTPDNVSKLLKNIINNFSDYTLLISNGPRTGKHNPATGDILKNHIDDIMDPVTEKFIQGLEQKQIKYKLFDFQMGKPSYKNLIFATIISKKDNRILIPGESTSMISEATDLIQNEKVIIYLNEAMNDNHKKHISSEFEAGRASLMDLEGNINKVSNKEVKTSPAKVLIAQEIIKQLKEKNMEKTATTLKEIKLVGISAKTSYSNEINPETAKIGATLGQYHGSGLANKINGRKNPGVTYCVYTEYESDEKGEYTYFVGEEVDSFDNMNESLEKLVIPTQNYSKFAVGPGQMPNVCIDAWMKIWSMNNADLGGERNFIADFEIYDNRASDLSKAVFDIYIGIK